MSDNRNTGQTSVPAASSGSTPRTSGVFEAWAGVRVDPAHTHGATTLGDAHDFPSDQVAPTSDLDPSESQFSDVHSSLMDEDEFDIVEEPLPRTSSAATHHTQFPYGDPLLQARQIAEHLQNRYAELHRREQRLNAQLLQLDQERRGIRMWVSECEVVIQQRDEKLSEREQQVETREAECLKVEHEIHARKAALLAREKDMQDIQTRWRAEWERERIELQKQLDQKRIEIQNEEIHFKQVKETQLAEIQKERTLLMNRIRFQEEHLQKLRREFEVTQNSFYAERQKTQAYLNEMDLQLQRRQKQLATYRLIVEERDTAVQRQHILLAKTRQAGVESLVRDHQRMVADQRDWQQVRERQQSDIVRQTEMLRLNAENLEARQQRLETLRLELEETNRRTLEMRLVVEEACAQLAQAVGPESTRQRLEAAQRALAEHYRNARQQILVQRQELEQFQKSIIAQRDQLRTEQQSLSDWMSRQDEELRVRDAKLRQEEATSISREQAWNNLRERWMLEKLEAEAIIRDLLKRLESNVAATPVDERVLSVQNGSIQNDTQSSGISS